VREVADDVACAAMSDQPEPSAAALARALRNARRLQLLNVVTLAVAVTVWAVLVVIAAVEWLPGLAVFATCVMLAELLVFQIVRTLLDHLALARDCWAEPVVLDSGPSVS
jgi:hypothetical protein